MNGAGKTSIVHALMLAFLGRRAAGLPGMFESGREHRRNYEQWVSACHNQSASTAGNDLMSIGISFVTDGGTKLGLRRSWWFSSRGALVDETLEVVPASSEVDAEPLSGGDAEELLSRLLPRYLADFLFFDGEDIRAVAPDGRTLEVEAAFDRLLGLEAFKRLLADIERLKGGKRRLLASDEQLDELEIIEQQLAESRAQLDRATKVLGQVEAEIEEVTLEITSLDDLTASVLNDGVPLTATQIRRQQQELMHRRTQAMQKIGRQIGDWLFLLPAQPLIEQLSKVVDRVLIDRALAERAKLQHEAVSDFVEQLERRANAKPTPISSSLRKVIDGLVAESANRLDDSSIADPLSELTTEELHLVERNAAQFASGRMADVQIAATELKSLNAQLSRLDYLLAQFESSTQLERWIKRRQELSSELLILQDRRSAAGSEATTLAAACELQKAALGRLQVAIATDDDARAWIDQAESVQVAIAEYVWLFRASSLGTLEENLLRSLRILFRKEHAVAAVKIDRTDYSLDVRDRSGQRLLMPSAGEHQLLALGFAQAMLATTKLALPFFIDTPLGRLDSAHRRAIAGEFLAQAANQVFVFSTDEEFVGDLEKELRNNVCQTYLVEHLEEPEGSRITPGTYF
jgi:DNA sulfur modification protein DndD